MNYLKEYVRFLKKRLKLKAPLKVIFDSSNGTTGSVLKKLTSHYPLITSHFLNAKPNGHFPAHGPNPLHWGAMHQLKRAIIPKKVDLGVIFDADGDRVFFVDDRGREIDPDAIAHILIGKKKARYLADVRSGYLLRNKHEIISPVGHTTIKKIMRKHGIWFDAERSGHYYFKDFFYADSGILAAILVLNFVSQEKAHGIKLSAYLDELPRIYHSRELNFKVKNAENILTRIEAMYKKKAKSIKHIDGLSVECADFWFNVRASNTEPYLRLNMEAKKKEILERELMKLKKIIIS